MFFLEVLALTGYSIGVWIHLCLALIILRQPSAGEPQDKIALRLERILLWLTICVGIWHGCNLLQTLFGLINLTYQNYATAWRVTDSLLVVSITATYSLLLHAHLLLSARTSHRELTLIEQARVYLSYLSLLFVPFALQTLWMGTPALMFDKLRSVTIFNVEADFVFLFALWSSYALAVVAVTDLIIARRSPSRTERRMMQTLAASFLIIAILILIVHAYGFNRRTLIGTYLETVANLGSLLPTALLAYYVYRYRYLELIIKRSLVVATFAVLVLAVYLFGIKTVGAWLTARYGLRGGVAETLLIFALAFAAAPLRGWLERQFQFLFKRETELYRQVIHRLAAHGSRREDLPELLTSTANSAARALDIPRIEFHLDNQIIYENADDASPDRHPINTASIAFAQSLHEDCLTLALHHEAREFGVMKVFARREQCTDELQQTLRALAAQVSLAIEKSRLIEENIDLERRIAHGARLAALGQMTATVAHEIKNPLSSIKAIAQVMREDTALPDGYEQDLDLIIGETDRLNRSLSQMLRFSARPAISSNGTPATTLEDLAAELLALYRHEAESRGVVLDFDFTNAELSARHDKLPDHVRGVLRDSLSNLLLNALHAAPPASHIKIAFELCDAHLSVIVSDEGDGIAPHLREKIFEPFFTTKQQGTGLGLSIVRKRLQEINGTIQFINSTSGATFQIVIPRGELV